MRERLARALGDPTLDVAYRLGDGRYVDAAGRPIELPQRADRAVTAVTVRGEEIAALVHDPALLDEPALVESVRATAALVLENERLAAEVRSQLAEVRASRGRIVAAADAERRRIERNLHDGAQQRLVTLSVALGLEASRADGAAADVLSRAQDEVEQAIGELRELARGIHPTLLRDEGLAAAVEALARRAPLPVTVESSVRDRLPDPVELAAYFVVSEALTNVVKHASASEASVRLEREPATLRVTVTDDGVGGARITPESGLAGLRDRLEALDATLSIDSEQATARTCAPSSHAGRNRRRRTAHPRGSRPPAHGKRRRGHRSSRRRRRPASQRPRPAPGRRARRHSHASDAHGRRTARSPRNPFALPRHRRPRPLATPRARLRAPTRRSRARTSRLSDEGTRRPDRSSCSTPCNASQRASASSTGRSSTTYSRDAAASIRSKQLTSREREILALMAEGRSNQGICRALWLSPKTVETHIRGAFAKLGIREAPEDNRRVLAVLAYLRR